MLDRNSLPKQPNWLLSYWNVGVLLHCSVLLFVLESYFYWVRLRNAFLQDIAISTLFWLACLLFAFSHIFLVIMDAWSRFQNYKRIKDHLYIHGFTPKLARHYSGSKCQRNAVLVAAAELGIRDQVENYYKKLGIKWFHFIPQFMVRDPLFLFKRYFWSRTFMEKYYEPRINFQALNNTLQKNIDCNAYRKESI